MNVNGTNYDTIYFSGSQSDGYGDNSHLYVVTPSTDFDFRNGRGNGSFLLKRVSTLAWSSITRPIVSSDGLSVWLGGTAATLEGWVNIGEFLFSTDLQSAPIKPSWSATIQQNEKDPSQPLLSSGALSSDGRFLYITGASNSFYCLNARSGRIKWEHDEASHQLIAEPKFSMRLELDQSVVYTIESLTGKVRQHDATSGTQNWEFDCSDLNDDIKCEDRVEAEFTLSSDGNILYYGDVSGNINAIQVAAFGIPLPPTESPSAGPTPLLSAVPSMHPSVRPTTDVPTSTPSIFPAHDQQEMIDSSAPSVHSSSAPSALPSFGPSFVPSLSPSLLPSFIPSFSPSSEPSAIISFSPTNIPSPQNLITPVKLSIFSIDLFLATSRRISLRFDSSRNLLEFNEQELLQALNDHLYIHYGANNKYFTDVELDLTPKGDTQTKESIMVKNEFTGTVLFTGPSFALIPSEDELDSVTLDAFSNDSVGEFLSRLSSLDDPIFSTAQSVRVVKQKILIETLSEPKLEDQGMASGGINKSVLGTIISFVIVLVIMFSAIGYKRKKEKEETQQKKLQWLRACRAAEEATLSESPIHFQRASNVTEDESRAKIGSVFFQAHNSSSTEESGQDDNPTDVADFTKKS
uniref:Circumsporozoite protein n=2 Tax=Ditylum brightwellii TaxID=49249 RepID=A0A7S4V1S0_9STRA